jgi:hypothetical protein
MAAGRLPSISSCSRALRSLTRIAHGLTWLYMHIISAWIMHDHFLSSVVEPYMHHRLSHRTNKGKEQ